MNVPRHLNDYLLRPDAPGQSAYDRATLRAMQGELRALVAAARAAENHSHAEIDYDPDPGGEARMCPICRALARLRRASGSERGRRRG